MGFLASRNRLLSTAAALAVAVSFGGCQDTPKTIGDYLNLRNSFLDPSQVGRFDKASPWGIYGPAKPVTWPILDQLDVLDEPVEHWTNATDPLPSDLVADTKEYTVAEGDQLRVSVFELVTPGLEYVKPVAVNELGNITLQNLGTIHVAELTPTQIEDKIGQIAIEKGFLLPKGNGNPGPQVSVTLELSRERVYSTLGALSAGTYPILNNNFRLLDAIAQAHDIQNAGQPGMDYLYVIRTPKGAGVLPYTPPTATAPAGAAAPAGNPLDAIDSVEKGTGGTRTTPGTAPGVTPTPGSSPAPAPGQPSSEMPHFLRPITTADIVKSGASSMLAQADLDAALGGIRPSPSSPDTNASPASRPANPANAGAAASPPSAAVPPAPAVVPLTPGTGNDELLNQAVGGQNRPGYVYVDGKWVMVSGAAGPATNAMSPAENIAAASGLSNPRVIRIPIDKLREGDPRYNIVIHPGDVIHVPAIVQGEFYFLGHVGRPGVFSLTGRKVTLKQAIAAAGGLDSVAIPRRCDLIRRIGPNQEVTVQIDLQRIFDGEQPDIYLKANDLINVGTDFIAPFLAVTRNAYRASYGWGFVYDKNLNDTNNTGNNNNNNGGGISIP
jgi:protein involved in polysaccharide export with SLBB domain